MPSIDLSILNQRQTPAFFADTLANRPVPSYVGRIFISTDTLDLYRDTGTAWVLLSPSSTGTITGSGAAGQVTYFSAASSITGNNNLFWDTANNRLGINNNTPGASLDVHSATSIGMQLNQTTASNNTEMAFQYQGAGKWRIGNIFNGGANDYTIYDVVNSLQRLTIKNTGQTLIGTTTTGSGKLVVASANSDNGVQIVGASAPSLRIDNAETGATKRIGLGISTGVNNFIQGSADRDMCIFNGSTTASSMLFGIYDTTNVQEAARISAARNFIVGSSVDAGYKFDVNGAARVTGSFYADNTIRVGVGIIGTSSNNLALSSNTTGGEISFWNNQIANRLMTLTGSGNLGIGTATPGQKLVINTSGGSPSINIFDGTSDCYIGISTSSNGYANGTSAGDLVIRGASGISFSSNGGSSLALRLASTGAATFSNTITASSGSSIIGSNNGLKIGYDNLGGGMYFADGNNLATFKNWRFGTSLFVGGDLSFTPSTTNGGTTFSTPAMLITTSSNLLIGTSTDGGQKLQVNGSFTYISEGGTGYTFNGTSYGNGMALANKTATTGSWDHFYFQNPNGNVGSISTNGSVTTYNSLSDYRLKEDLKDFIGLDLVNSIKTYDFKWKYNEDRMYGVIAHELQSILPYAVNGEKDGKDNQAVDYSKIVPLLVKAIQELNIKIEKLK
jgi:hypothetical protein